MYVDYLKYFLKLTSKLTFFILWQVNLFYDMHSKFQNKVLLPKKICEVQFINSLSIWSVALLQFVPLLIWPRVRAQLVRISELLCYAHQVCLSIIGVKWCRLLCFYKITRFCFRHTSGIHRRTLLL
jgi:hypothetical protein